MTRQPSFDPSQSTFSVSCSHPTGAGKGLDVVVDVVGGDVEDAVRLVQETLLAVPGHVLDHEEGTVGDESVVQLKHIVVSVGVHKRFQRYHRLTCP